MLTTLVDEPFDSEDWVYEIKWDGYRAISSIINGSIELYSRNNISFKHRYHEVIDALSAWDTNAVLDGEVVALDENGHSKFQFLQNWQSSQRGSLVYYVFDILWLDGYDVTQMPLLERKQLLKEIIPGGEVIRYSDHVEKNGINFFKAAREKDLEGIIAKNKKSSYEIGVRSRNWLKIKTEARQEAVICGFTAPRASRQYFGALILGIYEDDKLVYAGHTGSGFNEKSLKETWNKLQPLITHECPFDKKPRTNMPATWVKPKLVCEIKFQEWTHENIMRVPIFMGLRPDKEPGEVKKEKEMATKKVQKSAGTKEIVATSKNKPAVKKPTAKTSIATNKKTTSKGEWLDESEKETSKKLNGHELKLTNLDKIYWKKEGYTKRDLLNYYHAVAPYMLPYMKNRPQSLNRHPNGINGMSFFQKNVRGKVANWIETFEEYSESTDETVHYFVCTNEASLVYLANLGCIEMNPWHSTTMKPNNPDYCLIDLDPHEIGFDKVIESAQGVKRVLDELDIPAWCKTSGASGLHICIPLGTKYTYDQSRQLAELLANLIHHEVPSFTSVERSPSKRRKKVYLDYLQNSKGQTVACVYSARPKPGATVSTPVFWEEVKKGLSPSNFTIKNLFERLKAEGDIFRAVYAKGIDLRKTLSTIESILQ